MPKYMLSVHTGSGPGGPPPTEEEMAAHMAAIEALEADMKAAGAWTFSARMHAADTATVVHHRDGEVLTTDGPFVESKEHLAGFYLIEAADLDEALRWGTRTSECVRMPIEVRPLADWAA